MSVDEHGKSTVYIDDTADSNDRAYCKEILGDDAPFGAEINGKCQKLRQANGDTLYQCPGCQKIVDKHGKTKLEQGNCDKYFDGSASEKPSCNKVESPNGERVIQCPGCLKVIDKEGNTRVQLGPNCDQYDDTTSVFEGMRIQRVQ